MGGTGLWNRTKCTIKVADEHNFEDVKFYSVSRGGGHSVHDCLDHTMPTCWNSVTDLKCPVNCMVLYTYSLEYSTQNVVNHFCQGLYDVVLPP